MIRARFWKNLAKRLIIASGSNLWKIFELGRREAVVESTMVTAGTVLYFCEYRNTRTLQNYVKKCWIGALLVMNSEDNFNGCTNLKVLFHEEKQQIICPGCSFTYNKAISASFDMTISNKFLQLQLINWGRSTQSFVKFSFPCSFLLRATNTKHLIDTEESLKLLDKNKISYNQPGWKMLNKMNIYLLLVHQQIWHFSFSQLT